MSGTKTILKSLRVEYALGGLTTAGTGAFAVGARLAGHATPFAENLASNILSVFGIVDGICQISNGIITFIQTLDDGNLPNEKYLCLTSLLELIAGTAKTYFSFSAVTNGVSEGLHTLLISNTMTIGLQLNVIGFLVSSSINLVSALLNVIQVCKNNSNLENTGEIVTFNDAMLNLTLQAGKVAGWALLFCAHPGGLVLVFLAYSYQGYNLLCSQHGIFKTETPTDNDIEKKEIPYARPLSFIRP